MVSPARVSERRLSIPNNPITGILLAIPGYFVGVWLGTLFGLADDQNTGVILGYVFATVLFLAGVGAHFEGTIEEHTKHVLDELEKNLICAGSSMEKVLKVNVYLNDIKDWAKMNTVYAGRWGKVPPVRTTVAPAGGIPGGSLVEIDLIAYI